MTKIYAENNETTLIITSLFGERNIVFATATDEFYILILQDLDLHPKFRYGEIYYEESTYV